MSAALLTSRIWWNKAVTLTWKVKPIMEEKIVAQQASLFQSSPTLIKRDIPSSYFCYQLAPSARPTEGIGSGLLQTPKSAMPDNLKSATPDEKGRLHRKTGSDFGVNLADQIAMLPTPNTCDSNTANVNTGHDQKKGYLRGVIAMLPTPKSQNANSPAEHGQGGEDLQTVVSLLPTPRANKHTPQSREDFTPNLAARIQMLPTPATRDYKGANGPDHMSKDRPHMDQLPNAITHGTNRGLKLQPAFVEWMMGYPKDWTKLEEYPANSRAKLRGRGFTD